MEPAINEIKSIARSFYDGLVETLFDENRSVDYLRIKIITFRDFSADTNALAESRFFELPDETGDFQAYVDGIIVIGGCDEPENGLEALAAAMNSDWTNEGTKRRHIIVFSQTQAVKSLRTAINRIHSIPCQRPRTWKSFRSCGNWAHRTGSFSREQSA